MRRTAESVSMGHPDKICDQISDAILDEFLSVDPLSKVACECFITNNMLVIGGEAHSTATVNIIRIAKKVLNEIGYNKDNGFDTEGAIFINTLHEQSPDIQRGIELGDGKIGAGDQGTVYGFACRETPQLMPLESVLANETMKSYDMLRRNGSLPNARPDAKCQYSIDIENPEAKTLVFSLQHNEDTPTDVIKKYVDLVLDNAAVRNLNIKDSWFSNVYGAKLINPTGNFVIGGPQGDTGLTGRKIIVDTYGGRIAHGGGAFSGKDPTKVDRSAAYFARYIAKNLVAGHVGNDITVGLSYAIGYPEPVDISVRGNLFFPEKQVLNFITRNFDASPYGIIEKLDLRRPIYRQTATYGHFGNPDYPWEQIDNDIQQKISAEFFAV